MLTAKQFEDLKKTNLSVDTAKSRDRISAAYKAASTEIKKKIIELSGLSRASFYNAFQKGSASPKMVLAVAQHVGVSPYYFTGESDEQGVLTDKVLSQFIEEKNILGSSAKKEKVKKVAEKVADKVAEKAAEVAAVEGAAPEKAEKAVAKKATVKKTATKKVAKKAAKKPVEKKAKAEKVAKTAKVEKTAKVAKAAKAEKPAKVAKTAKVAKAAKAEKPAKAEKVAKVAKKGKPGRPAKAVSEKAAKAVPEKGAKGAKAVKAAKTPVDKNEVLMQISIEKTSKLQKAVANLNEEDAVMLLRALIRKAEANDNAKALCDIIKSCLLS
ncbi:MAG: hypothetical protein FWH20_06490 [Oscillospiraceae bacterium]|nr:hypothetical protein [Oscillospiraceae bacterium]